MNQIKKIINNIHPIINIHAKPNARYPKNAEGTEGYGDVFFSLLSDTILTIVGVDIYKSYYELL